MDFLSGIRKAYEKVESDMNAAVAPAKSDLDASEHSTSSQTTKDGRSTEVCVAVLACFDLVEV